MPTPRSAKRLVNLYRLLRIGVPEPELAAFIGDEHGGPFQAAAILLATVIGRPADARALLTALPAGNPTDDIIDFLHEHHWPQLANIIESIRKATTMNGELANFQRWGTTVARFSFETYDLYLSREREYS